MSSDAVPTFDLPDEDEELLRRYEAAMEAIRKGTLPRFTSKDEYLRYLSRS